MATEGNGDGLIRRPRIDTAGVVRRLGGPLPVTVVAGGVTVAAAPEVIHLLSSVGVTAGEAGIGIAAGVVAAAVLEGGFGARQSPTGRTGLAVLASGAAGVVGVEMLHAVVPAVGNDPLTVILTGGALGLVTICANGIYCSSSTAGNRDDAAHARNLSTVVKVPVAVAGIGLVASAIIAATGGNPPDLGLVHAVTIGAAGAAAAPFALSRLHSRSAPKPRAALSE